MRLCARVASLLNIAAGGLRQRRLSLSQYGFPRWQRHKKRYSFSSPHLPTSPILARSVLAALHQPDADGRKRKQKHKQHHPHGRGVAHILASLLVNAYAVEMEN